MTRLEIKTEKLGCRSNPRLTNEELISGILSGSLLASKQFHLRYGAAISRLVWQLLGWDDEHEDVVQQVLVGIFTNVRTIRKPEALDSWVRSVTLRIVRDELRKRRKRRSLFSKSEIVNDDVSPDPRSPWRHSHIRSFYRNLERLSPDDQIVFVLKFLEELSNDEIADLKHCSVSTVKRRIDRAKSRFLKKAMRDYALLSLVEGGLTARPDC